MYIKFEYFIIVILRNLGEIRISFYGNINQYDKHN